jgi:rSAM/selenodomain-associated transferase 2
MKISIVMPALNEAECLPGTLTALRGLPGDFDILVVDGGSSDDTVRIAGEMDVPVVVGPVGRGPQMNYGASRVDGDVLLFLHADTLLPRDAHALIASAMSDPAVIGGCFRLGFDRPHPLLRFFSFVTRFSFRLLHYGDQAFFVRAGYFRDTGGYRAYPIMEDLDFWLRMVRRGPVALLDAPVVSSARRFCRRGVFRQQVLNTTLVLLYLLGVSPFTLSRFYRNVR